MQVGRQMDGWKEGKKEGTDEKERNYAGSQFADQLLLHVKAFKATSYVVSNTANHCKSDTDLGATLSGQRASMLLSVKI